MDHLDVSHQRMGTARPCFVSMHLEELEREGKTTAEALQEIKVAAGHMFTGTFSGLGSTSVSH